MPLQVLVVSHQTVSCTSPLLLGNAVKAQMRGQVESNLKQVEQARSSFTSAEQRLQECQEKLQRCKEKCAEQALTIRELQGQVSISSESWKMC